jgi:hypothetical protein
MPMRPMFLNMLLNCMYSGYEPKPSNLGSVSWVRKMRAG